MRRAWRRRAGRTFEVGAGPAAATGTRRAADGEERTPVGGELRHPLHLHAAAQESACCGDVADDHVAIRPRPGSGRRGSAPRRPSMASSAGSPGAASSSASCGTCSRGAGGGASRTRRRTRPDAPKPLRNLLPGGRWWRLEDEDEEEDAAGRAEASGATATSALQRMWALLAADRWVVFLGFASLVCAALSEIAIPHLLAASIFSAQNGGAVFYRSAKLLVVLCVISGIFSGVRSCCFGIANMILVKKRMREMLFDSILSQDIAFFDEETVGDLTSRLGSDCQQVSRVIANDLNLISRNLLQGIGALFYLLILGLHIQVVLGRTMGLFIFTENVWLPMLCLLAVIHAET